MNKEIDCQVVMIPDLERNLPEHRWTEWKITLDNTKLDYKQYVHSTGLDVYQHLYFTSNEDIKGEDKIYSSHNNTVFECPVQHTTIAQIAKQRDIFHKIVASTDSTLGLPTIPESFLKQYVSANGKIDKVNLEMEEHPMNKSTFAKNHYQLKISTTGEVIILNKETVENNS